MLESEIKRRCAKALESWGWEVVHIIQTNKNGWPDTEAGRAGRLVYIEFKRPGKNPEPLQEYRHTKLRNQGFEVLIVKSLEDIQHLR